MSGRRFAVVVSSRPNRQCMANPNPDKVRKNELPSYSVI